MFQAHEEFMKLKKELKALCDKGEEDSEEAEKLREQMDPLWFQMTDEERREINKDVPFPKWLHNRP